MPRKPLVIRGARQVGKTTLVNQFAAQYEQYIYLNLELLEDREPFENFSSIDNLINTLFFLKNKFLINMAGTKVVNSIGVSILIEIIEKLQEVDGKIGYYNLAPIVSKTFNIMGLTKYSTVFATEEEAVSGL